MADAAPASRRRTTVLPNGQSTYVASRNEAIPKGIVMMKMHITIPAMAYPIANHTPESVSQSRFRSVLTEPASQKTA